MTDFYVSTSGSDSNAGTQASPFKTILRASKAATDGSTVHVAPGTYQGGFQTTTNGVTYVSDVEGGAKIVPGPNNSRIEAWDNRGANVVIDGFEIDGSNPQGGKPWLFGVYTTGSNSVVRDMTVHDLVRDSKAWSAANSGGQGGAGIMGDGYYGGSNIKVDNNTVYNIGPANTDSGLVHGIYMATSGEVVNNLVHHAAGDGITSWHDATNLKVVGNTVHDSHTGILIGAGDFYRRSGPHDNSKIANNNIFNNDKGIEEGGRTGQNIVYTNNAVHGNDTNWLLKTGIRAAAVEAQEAVIEYVTQVQQPVAPAYHDVAQPAAPVDAMPLPVEAVAVAPAPVFELAPVQDDFTLVYGA